MWKIIFPKKLLNELKDQLFSIAPKENGCFLLGNSYKTKNGRPVIIITEIIKPDEHSWNRCGEHSLEPSSRFINHAVTLAEEKDSSLVLVHTHPNSLHPPGFSFIDEESNKKLFDNLSTILDRPLGSLVFSRHGIHGIMFESGKIMPISTIQIVGHTISESYAVGFNSKQIIIDEKFDRQSKAIGKERQEILQGMTIAVVGCGGTGSAVVAQLARMGVRKLLLVDSDVMEQSNVPRVYGSTLSDCRKPKTKVEVLKQHIETFSNTQVDALEVDVTKTNITIELIDSNVIFACTDNLSSRDVLNKISLNYCIPLIDVGCKIEIDRDETIKQAIIKVQVVTPDDACLWCTGALDGKIILQESLPKDEKEKLAREGYYEGVDKQPSIITTTTKAAVIAVEKLLCLLGAFGPDYHTRTYIETRSGIVHEDTPEIKPDCICQKERGTAGKKTRIRC